MSKLLVDEIGGNAAAETTIASGKKIAGTASQFKMTDVVQGDVLYGSAADTLSRLAPGTAGQVLQTQGAAANPVWAADAGGLFSSYAIIADQKSQNTNGGTFTSGAWRTRDLQTETYDGIGLTISSDEFTLPAGNYLISWAAMAGRCAKHQSRLYDVTGTAQVGVGSSCVEPSDATYVWQVESSGAARVTPSGSNAYRIEHRCETTRADVGFGTPANFTTEQYTLVTILKES